MVPSSSQNHGSVRGMGVSPIFMSFHLVGNVPLNHFFWENVCTKKEVGPKDLPCKVSFHILYVAPKPSFISILHRIFHSQMSKVSHGKSVCGMISYTHTYIYIYIYFMLYVLLYFLFIVIGNI